MTDIQLEYKEYMGIKPIKNGEDYTEYMPEFALKMGLDPEEAGVEGWNWSYTAWLRHSARVSAKRESGNCYCRKCGDLQVIPVLLYCTDLKRWELSMKPCECVTRRAVRKNTEDSGISRELGVKNFHTFKRDTDFRESLYDHALDYLQSIKNGKKTWFYIGGQTGSGKTHLCTAIANRFLQNNYKLKYMRWTDESYKSASERNNLTQYKEAEILYIDDLFKTSPSEYMIGMAFELINYRDTNDLITIISSELQADALREIDTAIYGRIRMHTGKEFMISISADDDKNYRESSTSDEQMRLE